MSLIYLLELSLIYNLNAAIRYLMCIIFLFVDGGKYSPIFFFLESKKEKKRKHKKYVSVCFNNGKDLSTQLWELLLVV